MQEVTNWLSPWIEWHITPAKYTANELLVHRGIDAIVTHAGGIEPLRTAIHADPQVHTPTHLPQADSIESACANLDQKSF